MVSESGTCARSGWTSAFLVLVALYAIFTLTLSLSYHWGYLSTLTDVGTFDQAIWGLLHGEPFLNTNVYDRPVNYLGFHFRPILALFVPLYGLAANVAWLIVAQSLALAFSAWPIFLLARELCGKRSVAFLWTLAYLFNPFLLSVAPWVFRPESLAVPFIASAMLGLVRGDFRLTLLSCLVVLLCKEHFGITVAGFGMLWWIMHRRRREAALLAGLGLAYSLVVLTVVMPALSPAGKHIMLEPGMGQLSRYGWLGGSLSEIAAKLLFKPGEVIDKVFAMGGGLYLLLLLGLLCLMPLLAPEMLLPGVADLLANLLSANPMPRSPFSYHTATLVPIVFAATIYGLRRLSGRRKEWLLPKLSMLIAAIHLSAGYLFVPLPLPAAGNYWAPASLIALPDPVLPQVLQSVDEAAVSVQANVGAHFSQRLQVYPYPHMVGEVDRVVLHLDSPTHNLDPRRANPAMTGMLDAHLQMNRFDYLDSIDRLLASPHYGILFWQDPWLVLSTSSGDRAAVGEVRHKLERLREHWHGH